MKTYVILHNIRSAYNVGSIFRTADGAGVTKIFLCGYTPAPIDRFGRVVEEIRKTSLGASGVVPWEQFNSTEECVLKLRKDGVKIVAVEQHVRAIPYTDSVLMGSVGFVFGNEIDGVPEAFSEKADEVIHIPMSGMKESLNVGVATGIVLFHARDKHFH